MSSITGTTRPIPPRVSARHGVDVVPPDVGAEPEGPARLQIVAWVDPVVDTLGYDPRSWYVEQFWLPVIGPTSSWFLRRMAAGFDAEPGGFALDLDETARALGLGGSEGRHSPFQRSLNRCVAFKLARPHGPAALGVRRRIPPLTLARLLRLPPAVQKRHADWWQAQQPNGLLRQSRNRARQLALQLLEIGSDRQAVELQLVRWRVHPALAHEATDWALGLRPAPEVG
ncbi:MAG TPA: hypothetical protein VNC61_06695 [Acidimicrobiales bacterium]|nr:hypothetical protein [Acidimicrobiales bacterium]